GSWSGDVDWSQESYPVNPGVTTFKWDYVKDSAYTSGSDCAWIDEIIFPALGGTNGAPSILISTDALNFPEILQSETATLPITITNTGTAVMLGSMQIEEPFFLSPAGTDLLTEMEFVIQSGSSLEMDVMFNPNGLFGNFSGILVINSDDPEAETTIIPLMGTAIHVSNEDQITPLVTELKNNYPNPFNPSTTIHFSIKDSAPVRIEVYNILGQRVRTLVNETKKAGVHSVTWNGTDDSGRNVSSGIYFYRMNSGKYTSTKKMIMLK
ncbi:MAG: T9SS type A sorting domain-containing protein, partial [Candidatus Cloacimonetes bacterium]|nr:T9SS type A sorting domain-containing protein [Candidatus Cloacimonadota bacterium]